MDARPKKANVARAVNRQPGFCSGDTYKRICFWQGFCNFGASPIVSELIIYVLALNPNAKLIFLLFVIVFHLLTSQIFNF
jgi:hypothetical protein